MHSAREQLQQDMPLGVLQAFLTPTCNVHRGHTMPWANQGSPCAAIPLASIHMTFEQKQERSFVRCRMRSESWPHLAAMLLQEIHSVLAGPHDVRRGVLEELPVHAHAAALQRHHHLGRRRRVVVQLRGHPQRRRPGRGQLHACTRDWKV